MAKLSLLLVAATAIIFLAGKSLAWNRCACPKIYTPVCVKVSARGVRTLSNTCEARCRGYTVR